MSAIYHPMSISKKFWLVPSVLAIAIHLFFKNLDLNFMIFHTKNCVFVGGIYM